MKPRILIVLEAGDAYPSGFVRGLIYKDYFQNTGLNVKYISRINPSLIRLMHYPPRWLSPLMSMGLRRLLFHGQKALTHINEALILRQAKNYEIIYMSKVTSLPLVSRLRQATPARLVLDFGDALWLPGRGGAEFNQILRLVDAVTTDNELTASYVRQINPNCAVIPDCPQIEWFDRQRPRLQSTSAKNNEVVLGWIGTPGTAYNLFVIWEVLERLFTKYPNISLRLVGVGSDPRILPPFERIRYSCKATYSQAEMIEEVFNMDIGLFPMQEVEASKVRGVLKATVYMAGEAAVVCSPIGQCQELIQDGVNGFLANSGPEWERKIEILVTNPELRQKITQAGLETVRSNFTVEKSFRKLLEVLNPQGRAGLERK